MNNDYYNSYVTKEVGWNLVPNTLQPLKFRSITCLQFLTKCFMPVSVTLKFDRQDILINIFVCFILYKKLKVQ